MNLDAIRDHARGAKEIYWRRLASLRETQGAVLLPFARDAFRDEVERSNQLDTKGNWTLVGSLALLGGSAALGRQILPDISPSWLIGALLALAMTAFAIGAVLAVMGTRIRAAAFTTTPEIALEPNVLASEHDLDLQRHLILHYLDLREWNAAVSERRADMIAYGQWALIVGIVIAAMGLAARMVA